MAGRSTAAGAGPLLALLWRGVLVSAIAATASACGTEDEKHRSPPPSHASTTTGAGGSGGSDPGTPCPEGATRDCHVTLGEHNGVLSCFDGVQTCDGGVW